MVRIGKRPLWKRRLYLEFMAADLKGEILMEGYMVLLLGLTSPLWCWRLLPWAYRTGKGEVRRRIEAHRRAPYGGVNIAENNTARQTLAWRGRKRALSRATSLKRTETGMAESPLLRLPEEIRRHIFSYLVRPADELTMCTMTKEMRLVAIPTYVWEHAYADAQFAGMRWKRFEEFLQTGETPKDRAQVESCKDLLTLAKASRSLYHEVIPMLYGENIFNFHPLRATARSASIEHFLAFTQSMPGARFNDLRHLRLLLYFDFWFAPKRQTFLLKSEGEYKWRSVCERLKLMKNLSTVRIRVMRLPYYMGGSARVQAKRKVVEGEAPERRILKQLVGVKARRECIVEIPWSRSVVGDLPGAEFEVREAEGAVDVIDMNRR